MPNEENTRQMNQANGNSNNGSNETVLAAIRAVDARVSNLEEVILARLNDTRPFEQQLMARLNELFAGQTEMRADFDKFRQETNDHFRKMRKRQELLNEDHMEIRAEHSLLEKRVEHLEDRAA